MSPTLIPGDAIISEMVSRVIGCPFNRGDIVSFRAKDEIIKFIPRETLQMLDDFAPLSKKSKAHFFRKRIVGIPGDRIEITDGTLVVNGKPFTAPWAIGFDYKLSQLSDIGIANYHPFAEQHEPIIVPEQNYFVLGDKRDCVNLDSHIFGFVKYDSILARALIIFWREGKFTLVKLPRGTPNEPAVAPAWNKKQAIKAIFGFAAFVAIFFWANSYDSSHDWMPFYHPPNRYLSDLKQLERTLEEKSLKIRIQSQVEMSKNSRGSRINLRQRN